MLLVAVGRDERPALEAAQRMDALTHLLGRSCTEARLALGLRRGPLSLTTPAGQAIDVACTDDEGVMGITVMWFEATFGITMEGWGPQALLSIGQ